MQMGELHVVAQVWAEQCARLSGKELAVGGPWLGTKWNSYQVSHIFAQQSMNIVEPT